MIDQLRGNVAVFAHGNDAGGATIERLKKECPGIEHVELLCVEKESDLLQLSSIQTARSPFDAILTCNKEVTFLSKQLHTAQKILNPDGILRLWTTADKNSALLALVIAGFVDVKEIPGDEIAFAPCKLDGAEKSQCFSARRPQFTVGESVKMPQQDKKSTTISHSARKWKLTEEDDEFIDEDSLLDDTEEVRKAAKNDCGVSANGKRRACKNCTCGRAETENASNPVVSDQELSQMVSSCGNCFKGDAFRCGACPFLGKPAFKPGMEKVVLNLDSSDDI